MIPEKRLAKGTAIPVIGLGTWQLIGKDCARMVERALDLGYRHIDTAAHYGNEEAIGEAIRPVERDRLFLTSKAWPDSMGERAVQEACDKSLERLNTDYLDLYLLHWPDSDGDLAGTFRGFRRLLDKGKVKAVGVSNFTVAHLKEALPLAEAAGITIAVNQVEYHPFLNQEGLLAYCSQNGIAITAYSPLARSQALEHPIITAIAAELQCTPAQVALRWLLQKGLVVIPKASSEEHARENLAAIDLVLSPGQMRAIDNIRREERLIDPSFAEFDKEADTHA